jgi:hypothetical protein
MPGDRVDLVNEDIRLCPPDISPKDFRIREEDGAVFALASGSMSFLPTSFLYFTLAHGDILARLLRTRLQYPQSDETVSSLTRASGRMVQSGRGDICERPACMIIAVISANAV